MRMRGNQNCIYIKNMREAREKSLILIRKKLINFFSACSFFCWLFAFFRFSSLIHCDFFLFYFFHPAFEFYLYRYMIVDFAWNECKYFSTGYVELNASRKKLNNLSNWEGGILVEILGKFKMKKIIFLLFLRN